MKFIHPHVRIYLSLTILVLLIGCVLLFLVPKVDGHLFVNSTHTEFLDFFFTYFTHVGGGIFVTLGSVLLTALFWKRFKYSMILLASINLILVAAITQFLKQIIFSDAMRPIKFIGSKILHTAPGVEVHTSNSFPSGHTAAGFAFFALVAFLYGKNKWIQILCAVVAVLIGYSRIYLSQHFLEDTVLGGAIGLGCFLLSYAIVSRFKGGRQLKPIIE